MAVNTYVALDKKTVLTDVASIEFTSISAGYTDLVLVVNMQSSYTGDAGNGARLQFNGDNGSGSLYSDTNIRGDGSSSVSYNLSNGTYIQTGLLPSSGGGTAAGTTGAAVINIQNYANTDVFKTVLSRTNSILVAVEASVGLWRNTAAITSIKYFGDGNILAGATFALYGVKAWAAESTPKATGGYVYSDSTYYYHAFPFTGTFTPSQSLTADILVVAGGGGGGAITGGNGNGGGGAGGFLAYTSQSLTATGYTCTVGAGGKGGIVDSSSTQGGNSSFGALTASVGGGRGAHGGSAGNSSGTGGSGGGGQGSNDATFISGAAGTAGQGSSGGSGIGGSTAGGGGGGGAGGAGANGGAAIGGAGGVGATSAFTNAIGSATGFGQTVSGSTYFAGGGAGSTSNIGTGTAAGGFGGGGEGYYDGLSGQNAMVSTGGGGGGGRAVGTVGGNGGSGIVIVRYTKA